MQMVGSTRTQPGGALTRAPAWAALPRARWRARTALALVGRPCPVAGVASAAGAQPPFTPVSNSPFATGRGSQAVAFSPSGDLLGVVNGTDNTVLMFSVGTDGTLTA